MNKHKEKSAFLRLTVFLFFLLSLVALAGTVSARSHMFTRDHRQTHQEGSTIDGPGFFSGDAVQIDGDVNGTTFAAGGQVEVNGDINGSLFVIGESVRINGEINGNIYGLGQTVQYSGQNEGEAFLAGERVTIEQEAQLGRDLFAAGSDVLIEGGVPRYAFLGGESVTLNSSIGGDANVSGESITLNDSASIEGDFIYDSPNEATISQSATVTGQTDYNQREAWGNRGFSMNRQQIWVFRILFAIFSLLATLIVWLVIRLLRPRFWMDTTLPIATMPLKTMGFGLLGLLATPFLIIILMMTIIGIPMGIILAMLYGIALYISRIIVALFISSLILKAYTRESLGKEFLLVLLGLFILELLMLIPYLGWLVRLLVVITGLGALLVFRREPAETDPAY